MVPSAVWRNARVLKLVYYTARGVLIFFYFAQVMFFTVNTYSVYNGCVVGVLLYKLATSRIVETLCNINPVHILCWCDLHYIILEI